MSTVQDRLRAQAASRLCAARPEFAAGHDLTTTQGLIAAYAAAMPQAEQDAPAVVVIGRFDLATWVAGTCEFALGVHRESATFWRRSFTKTIFLSGNPRHLRARFAFNHVPEDESMAWVSPGPASESVGLRRLLKLFVGSVPLAGQSSEVVEISPLRPRCRPARQREVDVATAGVSLGDTLVHLNHLLVEAVLDGLIAPGDRLRLRQVPRLNGSLDSYVALRVAAEQAEPTRLQAFAGLTEGRALD